MYRRTTFALFLAFGIVFQQSHGVEVNVTDKDQLCLYANLMVNFSVSYELAGNKSGTVTFELPGEVTTYGSECGTTNSSLKLNFGEGHSWSMNFILKEKMYHIDSVVFSYNLGDTTLFPNSTSKETETATVVKPHIIDVGIDTCYSCKSKDTIQADLVHQTLWNVLIQAFVSNGSKSEILTICAADLPVTTVAPTTTTSTATAAPVTNTTSTAPPVTNTTSTAPPVTNTTSTAPPVTNATSTAPPVTNATSTAPPVTNTTSTAPPVTNATSTAPPATTTPAPAPPTPTTGVYSIKPTENSTACLLASFGLRIGLYQANRYEEVNLDPNVTKARGLCGVDSSELVLESNTMNFTFTFINDTKKFRLHALNITGTTSSGAAFFEGNTNLSLWEASIGSSYMCNKEQNYTITDSLFLYTFNLQVQPFEVKKSAFSTAHECSLDDVSILIPIIVGATLAGLILIVVIAYVIGRRKTYVGYQTL